MTTADRRFPIRRAALTVLLFALVFPSAPAADKKHSATDGIIAGTVFDGTGRSLRGARVAVAPEEAPKKKREAISDGRGEFAIRVPAGASPYVVSVEAKGFGPQSKTVEVFEGEKASVTFLLDPK